MLHQVCSSEFVSPIWLNYLASFDPILVPSWTKKANTIDFRTTGSSYFQLLATFCSLVEINIADAQRVFTNTQFINGRVLTRSLFVQQSQTMIDSFITVTRNDFVHTFNWIYIGFATSQLFNGANINLDIAVSNDDQLNVEFTVYPGVTEIAPISITVAGVCSCAMRYSLCFMVPELYTNASYLNHVGQYLFFKVLSIGCIPLSGFLKSKITWWYNITYLEYIQATYSIVIHSHSLPNIKPLNASVPTQFQDVTMADLIREMFLEISMKNDTDFDKFYNECAPLSCSYTNVQRRDIIVVLFLLIDLCGGLNEVLGILVPLFGKLIFSCIDWWKNRNARHGKYYIDYNYF